MGLEHHCFHGNDLLLPGKGVRGWSVGQEVGDLCRHAGCKSVKLSPACSLL